MSADDKPLPTDETDAQWTVTGTAPDGTPWKCSGTGWASLQAVLNGLKGTGIRDIKTEVR